MKPKEALVKDGFLPPGSENVRGRLSLAAKERLAELAKDWDIEGYSTTKPVTQKAEVKDKPKDSIGIVDIGDPTRDEHSLSAFAEGKEIGMRTVCNICGASLTYCPCKFPQVNVDFDATAVVTFKERTTPLPKKRW